MRRIPASSLSAVIPSLRGICTSGVLDRNADPSSCLLGMTQRKYWLVLLAGLVACAPAPPSAAAPAAALAPTLTSSIGMEFVLIRPGSMVVGTFEPECPVPGPDGLPVLPPAPPSASPEPPPDPHLVWTAADYALCHELVARDATPGFPVTIDHPYYIGRYEVTQAEWKRVMGTNPSVFQGARVEDDADRHPVDSVTWEDAQAFVRRLNELDSTAHYRLPTEFEWEYAARAGVEGGLLWSAAREQAQTSRVSTLAVGQKAPNPWGLYDVFGNVWEWVEDWYNEKLFPDPVPPATGEVHVLKGASFLGDVKNLTYTTHGAGPANGWDVGFRVVREVR
jgi:formylglycine-generating enzyme required for sulfatase activity